MKAIRCLRKMASLCRQQAAYNPAQSSKLLAEAEYWEHLARAEMSSHFKECSATSSDAHELGVKSNVRDGRRLLPREYSDASGLAASVALETG
jgi:hypothetical protein